MTDPTPSLDILLVDDEQVVHDTLVPYLTQMGHQVDSVFDGSACMRAVADKPYQMALVDVRMPGVDGLTVLQDLSETQPEVAVVLITGHGDMEMAVQALRLGAADFLPKPVKLLDLDAAVARARHLHEVNADRTHLRDVVRGLQASEERERRFVGDSEATATTRQQVRQAVEGGADSILITGETGTGKEVIAREIHVLATDDDDPFIAISCPSLPESLVESELFGHVRGAFTGANRDRAGAFELAHGGTLFLDEVGDLSAAAQASLLRVLETRRVRRVGGSREIDIDVRVVAATNADLNEPETFRQDLLYRLNLFPIHLSPLRERSADILPLAAHFLTQYARRRRFACDGFTDAAEAALRSYAFPGNARELRNLVERAAIVSAGARIDFVHLSLPAQESPTAAPMVEAEPDDEAQHIRAALEAARWNRREAARQLGMPYSTLRYKIRRFGLG